MPLFAVTGMGGIRKTTLAQKNFNHPKIQKEYDLKIWVCVSQTYSEIALLQHVIRCGKGDYGNAETKAERQPMLGDTVVSCGSIFLVLDDVWRADVWTDLLQGPLRKARTSTRVLITTRYEEVAREMMVSRTNPVMTLSIESSWDMLCRRVFSEGQEVRANDLKQIGLQIVERCGGLPLAIKVIAGVLARKEKSRKEWNKVLKDDAWSTTVLPEELRGSLYLSFEDLPSNLKQCFLYCSLKGKLDHSEYCKLWVAEGFVTVQQNILMEDKAEEYFNEFFSRNLLLPNLSNPFLKGARCMTLSDLSPFFCLKIIYVVEK